MYNLEDFTFSEMVEVGSALRGIGRDAHSMREVADLIVRYLFDSLLSKEGGERGCVLVRFFKTQRFGELDQNLRRFAVRMLGSAEASPTIKCLVLVASAGQRPEWNSTELSKGHLAIPLPSAEAVAKFPMISQLLSQMGVSVEALLGVDPNLVLDMNEHSLGVFHVPEARGSSYVPAQEFVRENGVKSVVGFGGPFSTGDVFVVVLFSRVYIPRPTAELFRTLGLIIRLAIGPFTREGVYASAAVGA